MVNGSVECCAYMRSSIYIVLHIFQDTGWHCGALPAPLLAKRAQLCLTGAAAAGAGVKGMCGASPPRALAHDCCKGWAAIQVCCRRLVAAGPLHLCACLCVQTIFCTNAIPSGLPHVGYRLYRVVSWRPAHPGAGRPGTEMQPHLGPGSGVGGSEPNRDFTREECRV